MLTSLTTLSSVLTTAGTTRSFLRPMGTSLLAVGLVLGVATRGEALDVRHSEGALTVAAAETVDDTLVAMGETIEINGVVTGDVIAMGRTITIRGSVGGNLVAFAQDVDVEGSVDGAILSFAQTVRSGGTVAGSLYAGGQTVTIGESSQIGGDAVLFGSTAAVQGLVNRDVTAFAQRLDIAGVVERAVSAYAQTVTVAAPGRVGGRLTAHVPDDNNVDVAEGATITGGTDVQVRASEVAPSRYLTWSFYGGQILRLAAAFVTGWLFYWLAPGMARRRIDTPIDGLKALGIGFLCVVAVPVAAIIAGVTVIGLPIALLAVALLVAALYLAKIVIAAYLGRTILGPQRAGRVAAALLVGLAVVLVAVNVPYLGGLVNAVLTLAGVGLLFLSVVSWYRGQSAQPAAS
jgi:cytoskeletal protein CcmA (bactofilin family)